MAEQTPAAPTPPPSGQTPQSHVPPATPGQNKTSTATYIKTAIATIIAIYAILLILLNREQVEINFVFFQMNIALIFVLIGLLLVGALLGYMVAKSRAKKSERIQAP